MKSCMPPLSRVLCMSVPLLGMFLACVAGAVDIGEKAPDFTLESTLGDKISLSQFQGKKHVLIEFYSLDFNPV